MAKKYFWLKLKDNFFTQPKIKKLRRIAGGDTYTIIYLKMQLLSLKDDGKIVFENIEDNLIEELSLKLDEDIDNVDVTVKYLITQGLMEQITEDEYCLNETVQNIGSESSSAARMRRLRNKGETEKASHCDTNVQKSDIEIEKEIEKEIDYIKRPTKTFDNF